jgi:hypothetical protein
MALNHVPHRCENGLSNSYEDAFRIVWSPNEVHLKPVYMKAATENAVPLYSYPSLYPILYTIQEETISSAFPFPRPKPSVPAAGISHAPSSHCKPQNKILFGILSLVTPHELLSNPCFATKLKLDLTTTNHLFGPNSLARSRRYPAVNRR